MSEDMGNKIKKSLTGVMIGMLVLLVVGLILVQTGFVFRHTFFFMLGSVISTLSAFALGRYSVLLGK